MAAMLRTIANRGLLAGVVGLGLAATAVAQPPDDPIATSNKLTELPSAPSVLPAAAETPWLTAAPESAPSPPTPSAKALLERIISRSRDLQPKPVDPPHESPPKPMVVEPREPQPKPMVVEPCEPQPQPVVVEPCLPKPKPFIAEPREPQPKPFIVEPREPQPTLTPVVNWSAPGQREPIKNPLPTSDRPMIPCEPVADPFHSPAAAAPPMAPLPPPRPLSPGDGEPQTATAPHPTMTSVPDDDPPPRVITTVRFLDEAPPTPKPTTDDPIIAMIRRGGSATGSAADIRAAVERICHAKAVECQTEVAGERQVRVLLKMKSQADWQRLYERMQNLPELGEYGLLCEVRIEK